MPTVLLRTYMYIHHTYMYITTCVYTYMYYAHLHPIVVILSHLHSRSKFHIFEDCAVPEKPFPVPFPDEGEIYDYEFVKEGLGRWALWSEKLVDVPAIPKDAQFNSIIIPTVDTIRSTYLMDLCIKHQKPCLFVGPTGTGKSVYVQVRTYVHTG